MALDFPRFFKASNPSKTLNLSRENDRRYYIDFSSVRGGKIIRELERTITRLSPDEPTCQLFTGHIGCGKSTELLRLKAELEQQNFHVVYFESSRDLDMADVDISDILLAIARQVSESLEAIQIRLQPGYFIGLFGEIADWLQTPVDLAAEAELSLGIGKITAQTKHSPKLRSQLRQHLEPRTNGLLDAINQELLLPAQEKLQQQGYQGLVVIIDNLDRVDSATKPSGRSQPEYLFVDRGEQLKKLSCHVVYTVPLALVFSNDLSRLSNRFGIDPKVLPMVRVQQRDGSACASGMDLLRQMVLARAFPHLEPQARLAQIDAVFDAPETLDRLCRVSGGHVRNLLVLLYRCLQQDDPPIDRDCLERVICQRCNELSLAITPEEWALLKRVSQAKQVRGEAEHQLLLRSLFVFGYRDRDQTWFDLNPIFAEAKELQP